MTTTLDRYLIRRFLHVFVIGFIATFGLYVVIDGFTNVDGFQEATPDGSVGLVLVKMAVFYFYQSSVFFDLVAPILTVVGAMVVFALLQRNSELYPILSAGVPTYRMVVPVMVGALFVNLGLIVNQEAVIPLFADQLQAPRGKDESAAQNVEPVYDHKTRIFISGRELYLGDRKMSEAEFGLPVPNITREFTRLQAREAYYQEARGDQPSGWLLREPTPAYEELDLTDYGRRIVVPGQNPGEVFVVTDLSFDQLNHRHTSYRFLSTPQLMSRIKNPAYSLNSVRGQTLHLHERLTRPLMNLIAILMAVPLVVRREGVGLIMNLASCTGVLGLVFVLSQAFLYLSRVNLIAPDTAAWAPIIVCGSLSAWMSGMIQT